MQYNTVKKYPYFIEFEWKLVIEVQTLDSKNDFNSRYRYTSWSKQFLLTAVFHICSSFCWAQIKKYMHLTTSCVVWWNQKCFLTFTKQNLMSELSHL